MYHCGCTGTTVNSYNLLHWHARTCCSPVTTLCRVHCRVAKVCAVPISLSAIFCVSRRRRKMYSGHARLCVCLSVPRRIPALLHGPGCNLGNGRRCPLVVHYWADLQSMHGFRGYDNIALRVLAIDARDSIVANAKC